MSLPENPLETPVEDSIFRGWWLIVLSGIIMAIATYALEDFPALMFLPMSEELGWSRATSALGAFILPLAAGLMGPAVGYITDKIGPRRMVLIGLCVLVGCFVLLGQVENHLIFYLASLLMGMGAGLCGFIPLMTLLVRRFFRRLTAAIVVFEVISGVGGAFLISTLPTLVMEYLGWRDVLIYLACVALLLVIAVFVLLSSRPEGMGQRAYSALPAASQQFGRFSVLNFRVRSYWLIVFGTAFSVTVVATVSFYVGPMMVDRGFNVGVAIIAGVILTVFSTVFIVVGGVMAVRIPRHVLLGCFAGLQAVAAGGLIFGDSLVQFYLLVALLGAGYGGIAPLIVPMLADYFGTASFGKILGVYFLATRLLPFLGTPIAGAVLAIQGFTPIFLFLTGLALLSALCFVLARPPRVSDAVVPQVETG